tara:strand:+ start:709 stop:1509 length:801 start_codon:yes stop_codon:yes gene_type:complete
MKNIIRKILLNVSFLSLIFSLNANAGIIYDFDIRVNFGGGLTPSQQSVFAEAENFWESIIIGYSDEFAGPGLDISATGAAIDGVGSTLGSAGPSLGTWNSGFLYAVAGGMNFDSADLSSLESNNTLFDVIVHEMAHVIGFGTLWGSLYNDLLDGSNNYIGEHALAAYRYESGNPNASFVPVEQGGGPGTAGGHWDEPDGGGFTEIMTGWLDADSTISLTTINAFADLGYVVHPNFLVPEDVPEPSTLAIFALGIMGLASRRFNKKS